MDFAVPGEHRVQLKESKKRDKYLDFARELKKLRIRKVTVLLVVIGGLGKSPKLLIMGLEDIEIRRQVEKMH